MRRVFLTLLIALCCPASAQSYGELNATLVEQVVVPTQERYGEAIEALPASIEALCARPDQARLDGPAMLGARRCSRGSAPSRSISGR